MNSVRSNNLSLKYQSFSLYRLKRYRDRKIRVCGKDSISLFVEKLKKSNYKLKNDIFQEFQIVSKVSSCVGQKRKQIIKIQVKAR